MTEKTLEISNIWKGLKSIIFAVFYVVATTAILFFIYKPFYSQGVTPEKLLSEHKNITIFVGIIWMSGIVLVWLSIYKITKALNRNAAAWMFACIAFPIIVYFAIPYFFIVGILTILKLKFSKLVEQKNARDRAGACSD